MSIQSRLRAILDGGEVPADFEVIYDDLHGLWGGTRMVINGGHGQGRRERVGGDPEPEVFSAEVSWRQLLELIRLLVENRGVGATCAGTHARPRRGERDAAYQSGRPREHDMGTHPRDGPKLPAHSD
jgi:hypothetical protein